MSGFQTIYNDKGDRASAYVSDGKPDRVLKILGHDDSINQQFADSFRRRGYPEKYAKAEETPVAEVAPRVAKVSQANANYRSAFSAARCAICAHFQAGSKTCELVAGDISPDAVCDLYEPKREDATDNANKLFDEYAEGRQAAKADG